MADQPVKNVDLDEGKKLEEHEIDPEERGGIVFYCKDCGKIVDTDRIGMKYVYKCKICKTKNVAFGTEASIKKFFHVVDDPLVGNLEKKK